MMHQDIANRDHGGGRTMGKGLTGIEIVLIRTVISGGGPQIDMPRIAPRHLTDMCAGLLFQRAGQGDQDHTLCPL